MACVSLPRRKQKLQDKLKIPFNLIYLTIYLTLFWFFQFTPFNLPFTCGPTHPHLRLAQENVLHWGAKHRKIFSENMLLHARINTGITFPSYFSKHNQTAENILHIAKHNLKKKTSSAGLVMVLMDHKQICRSKAF